MFQSGNFIKSDLKERRRDFEARQKRLVCEFKKVLERGGKPRLDKKTSNLFRVRPPADRSSRLDVRDFIHVIEVDHVNHVAEVEGMTTYEKLVDATLPHGLMPAVVPQLKSITVGGAVTGGGIESSSFRYGFVHETVAAVEILTGKGETVIAKPDNEHSDLFYGFPNSYGSLGYACRLWIKLVPVRPYVRVTHHGFRDPEAYFNDMARICEDGRRNGHGPDFVDGTVFGHGELYRTEGFFTDTGGEISRYTFMNIYYHSIRRRREDWLTAHDYLWRWDPDWFWCSRAFGMENPVLRFIAGSLGLLKSTTYWKLRNWNERYRILQRLGIMRQPVEWVIQDVEIPVERAAEFHDFLIREIGILPFWICPAKAFRKDAVYPLYRTDPDILYINFGFWGGVKTDRPQGYYNRLVEDKVAELEGIKSLYSNSFFTEDEFWSRYNRPAYDRLRALYDPGNVFSGLYEKCVRS